MRLMTTDQYRPCWVELKEVEEATGKQKFENSVFKDKNNVISNKSESKKNTLAKFYGKFDSDKTSTE